MAEGECVFYAGDAREALRAFAKEGASFRVAYLDPPFLTGKDFGAYRDQDSMQALLALLDEVLRLCRELLLPDGSLYLHIDHRLSAHARLLLDEIFGEGCFQNEIIWAYQSGGRADRHFSRKHDTILFYGRGERPFFDPQAVALPRAGGRNHMRRGVEEDGREYSAIVSNKKEYRYYDDEGVPPSDVWADISHLQQRDPERTGYPTQKPEKLLERILLASSRAGDAVLDPFCGSGTALAVAARLARRGWGADSSEASLETVRERLAETPVRYLP